MWWCLDIILYMMDVDQLKDSRARFLANDSAHLLRCGLFWKKMICIFFFFYFFMKWNEWMMGCLLFYMYIYIHSINRRRWSSLQRKKYLYDNFTWRYVVLNKGCLKCNKVDISLVNISVILFFVRTNSILRAPFFV